MSLYVYAVGKASDGEPPPLQGIFDCPVFRLDAGPLCAIVSESRESVVRAERKHIVATQRVLAALNAQFDVLPMAFGTITKTEDDLCRFLDTHRENLLAQLQRISGAIEMSLRLNLEASDPIAYVVQRTPALQSARERVFQGRRPPSNDSKIRLGQMVEDALRQYREAHTARVLAIVGSSCAEIIALPVRGDREIANLAALVPRSGLDQFEAAVQASAAQIDEDIVFDLGGPWPPANFIRFDPDI